MRLASRFGHAANQIRRDGRNAAGEHALMLFP